MQENSLQAGQRLQGNPLESHLRTFVTSLLDDGYADATVHDKLSLLHRLGQWLRRTGRRSEEHTSELQSRENLVCRLLLEKKKKGQLPLTDTQKILTTKEHKVQIVVI